MPRNAVNPRVQNRTTNRVAMPSAKMEGATPNQAAASPDSNSPSARADPWTGSAECYRTVASKTADHIPVSALQFCPNVVGKNIFTQRTQRRNEERFTLRLCVFA